MLTSVCFTWKVCWGCWGPRLRSDLVSCYHHAVGFESHSEVYGFLLGGKTSANGSHTTSECLNDLWMHQFLYHLSFYLFYITKN